MRPCETTTSKWQTVATDSHKTQGMSVNYAMSVEFQDQERKMMKHVKSTCDSAIIQLCFLCILLDLPSCEKHANV